MHASDPRVYRVPLLAEVRRIGTLLSRGDKASRGRLRARVLPRCRVMSDPLCSDIALESLAFLSLGLKFQLSTKSGDRPQTYLSPSLACLHLLHPLTRIQ